MTVLSSPTTCDLPELPPPINWGGVPEYDKDGNPTGWTLITHDGLAEMAGYLTGLAQWARAAEGCIASMKQ